MIRIRSYPGGPRCWVLGQRVHHGSVGCVLVLGLFRHHTRVAALLGVGLALHDRRDWRVWFARERLPAISSTPSELSHKLSKSSTPR